MTRGRTDINLEVSAGVAQWQLTKLTEGVMKFLVLEREMRPTYLSQKSARGATGRFDSVRSTTAKA